MGYSIGTALMRPHIEGSAIGTTVDVDEEEARFTTNDAAAAARVPDIFIMNSILVSPQVFGSRLN